MYICIHSIYVYTELTTTVSMALNYMVNIYIFNYVIGDIK